MNGQKCSGMTFTKENLRKQQITTDPRKQRYSFSRTHKNKRTQVVSRVSLKGKQVHKIKLRNNSERDRESPGKARKVHNKYTCNDPTEVQGSIWTQPRKVGSDNWTNQGGADSETNILR